MRKPALLLVLLSLGTIAIAPPAINAQTKTAVVIATNVDGAGTNLLADIYEPPEGSPPWTAIALEHEGGYKAGNRGPHGPAGDLAAAGFIVFACEYRLAPPASAMRTPPSNQQFPTPSDGRPPQQTDDVGKCIHALRAFHDPDTSVLLTNGKVGGVGGSAGGGHLLWWAAIGTTNDTKPDCVVALSPSVNLDDATALTVTQYLGDCQNYINHLLTEGSAYHTAAQAASPYFLSSFNSGISPHLIINSELEGNNTNPGMPLSEYTGWVAKATSVGATFENFERLGAIEHGFAYWNQTPTSGYTGGVPGNVSAIVIDFLNRKLSHTAQTPDSPASIIIKRK